MRHLRKESIEFPANPFVALSDFTLLVVVVVTLGYVYQTLFNETARQRDSVTRLQDRLLGELAGKGNSQPLSPDRQALAGAVRSGKAGCAATSDGKNVDGDLQRISIDGTVLYDSTDTDARISESGRRILRGFGQILRQYQGQKEQKKGTKAGDVASGLYKRISVQGNIGMNEQPPNSKSPWPNEDRWRISQARAREAVAILQGVSGLDPSLLEATGRGCWDTSRRLPLVFPPGKEGDHLRELSDRSIDIVIFYSGPRALDYEKAHPAPPAPFR